MHHKKMIHLNCLRRNQVPAPSYIQDVIFHVQHYLNTIFLFLSFIIMICTLGKRCHSYVLDLNNKVWLNLIWVILLTTGHMNIENKPHCTLIWEKKKALNLQGDREFPFIIETKPIKLSDDNRYTESKTEHELTWHKHKQKRCSVSFFLHTVERDSCYLIPVIWKDKGSLIYECARTCMCVHHVCVSLPAHEWCSSY